MHLVGNVSGGCVVDSTVAQTSALGVLDASIVNVVLPTIVLDMSRPAIDAIGSLAVVVAARAIQRLGGVRIDNRAGFAEGDLSS